ncbi:MAG: hypothetical protein WDO17_06645 [Alphaproteobacteria bacterium]
MLCAAAFAGMPAFAADTHIYKDVLMPNGHARGVAEKFADFRACGYRKGTSVNDSALARIDACMRGHGWALDHVVPEPKRARQAGVSREHSAPKEYRRFDDEMGGWVTCHEILGGIGEACSN